MWQLIAGCIILLITIVFLSIAFARTPNNLRGWYGIMFGLISIGGFFGGVFLVVLGILTLI